METEIWKDIPSYRGLLQASNLGRVREYVVIKVEGQDDIVFINKILSAYHKHTMVKFHYANKYLNGYDLIAETFLPNSKGKYISYKDKDWTNLKPENLILVDTSLHAVGSDNSRSKLTEDNVLEIFKLIQEGKTAPYISRKYKIHVQNVYRIAQKKIWKHVERPYIDFRSAQAKIKRNKIIENQ